MLFLNYILILNSLLNNISRRTIIKDTIISSLVMNNNNIHEKSKYKIPELDSDDETKTILHLDGNDMFFYGSVSVESCFHIQQQILKYQKTEIDKINLHIQSTGGSLLPTFGLIDQIQNSKIPIDTYIHGYVASAASLISMAGRNRYMSKNSMMLIHSLRTTIGEVNYNQLEDHYLNSKSMMNIVKNIYKEKSNIEDDELEYLLNHDYWLNSTECLNYNLIDFIG